jgi:hypothetical protein
MKASLIITLGLFAVLLIGLFAQHSRIGTLQLRYDKHIAADAAALARGKDILERREAAHKAALNAVDIAITKEKTDEVAKRDAVIASLRAGGERVRDHFRCPTVPRPQAGTAAGAGDAAAPGGLSDQDAEFLVRFASEADQVAVTLAACQAVVRADRKL